MKIRLLARDSKMPNIAIMKISTYHKRQGHDVGWYNPILDRADTGLLYESQLFNFTEKYGYYPECEVKQGGTGISISKRLPKEIDKITELDYSLYPNCDYSMQFYSRGCIRQCSFCVVHDKEGGIKAVKPMELNPKGKHIEILDNNFFANPNWRRAIKDIKATGQKVNFHGVDARIMAEEQAEALNGLKHKGAIHIAWDFPQDDLLPKLKEITKWIKPYKLMCYVLIGYNSTEEEDLYRVRSLEDMGIDPFAIPYRNTAQNVEPTNRQKDFARWVNMKAVFKSTKWEDYRKR